METIRDSAMKFLWVNMTPLLVPVVPDEYMSAATSVCLMETDGKSATDPDKLISSWKWRILRFDSI